MAKDAPVLSPLAKMLLGSLVRALLNWVSAFAVAHQLITSDQQSSFVIQGAEALIAFLPAVISIGWSFMQKADHDETVKVALDLPKGSTLADVERAKGIT